MYYTVRGQDTKKHFCFKRITNHIEISSICATWRKSIFISGANAAIGVLLLIFNSHKEMDFYIENMYRFVEIQIEK